MAPKKRQKLSRPIVSIYSDWCSTLPSSPPQIPTSSSLSFIDSNSIERAYGLSSSSSNGGNESVLTRKCQSKWKNKSGEEDVEGKGKEKEEVKPVEEEVEEEDEKEVIVLGDTTDDEALATTNMKGKAKITTYTRKKLVVQGTTSTSTNSKNKTKTNGTLECSAENCLKNPNCLNWLGQDRWEVGTNEKKLWKEFRKSLGLPRDPENERIVNVPVGLRNLGATCYVNSFLQVWFRDVKFRQGVYSCEPPSNGRVESSPLFQLQVLFAFLQSSTQGVYNPTRLVESLKLDQSEQQDAQEFSKLFLSLLDHEFKKQGLKQQQQQGEGGGDGVGRLIQEQFEGKQIYGTRCKSCRKASERSSTFLELEIGLTANCKLEDRIKHSLQDEQLTGDNQYYCENCDAKRDATRYTKLESLPPVLHFSLLRFVFYLKDFTRAKSQHAISYPLSIDMSHFLPPSHSQPREDSSSPMIYDLKGVLMHKGTSAHHGHYVAQVYDESESKWFLFDDESVEPVEDLNAPIIYDQDEDDDPVVSTTTKKSNKKKAVKKVVDDEEEGEEEKAEGKAMKGKKGTGRDVQGKILPKSKDAYMLVYIRRPNLNDPNPPEPIPPPLALAEVERLDAAYRKEVEEWNEKTASARKTFDRLKEEKRSVYTVWDVKDDKDDSYLVDKTALKRWVESGLKPTKPTSSVSNPSKKGKERAIDDAPTGEDSKDKSNDGVVNEDVDMSESRGVSTTPSTPVVTSNDRTSPNPSTSRDTTATAPVPKESSLTPPPSSEDDSRKIEPMKMIDNSSIGCPHGHANPLKVEQMKRISKAGYEKLIKLGVEIDTKLKVPTDLCRLCVEGMAREYYYHDRHRALVDEVSNSEMNDDGHCVISKPWFIDWKKEKPKMHSTASGTDPSPASEPYISDVICPHGKLQPEVKKRMNISVEAASLLCQEFPDFQPLDPDPCGGCAGVQEVDEKQLKEMKEVAMKEKKILKTFDGQLRLTTRLALTDDHKAHYLVPRDWIREWMNWARPKGTTKPTQRNRPSSLSNASFLCQHSLLTLDLAKEIETSKTIQIATAEEWRYLVKAYDAGPEIRVWQERGEVEPKSSPAVCKPCLDERRRNFESTNLWVKILQDSDFDKDGHRRVDDGPSSLESSRASSSSATFPSAIPPSRQYGTSIATGTRKSVRVANKPTQMARKEWKHIEMEKGDTVKDLKPKIEESTGIPIISQRLFFASRELVDSSTTVEQLGLIGDATIEVFEVKFDEDGDLNLLDVDVGDEVKVMGEKGKKAKKRTREEGFGGTGLFGFDLVERDEGTNGSVASTTENRNGRSTPPSTSSSGTTSKRTRRQEKNDRQRTDEEEEEELAIKMAIDQVNAVVEGGKVSCPHCTFLNAPDVEACEVCEGSLNG